jgi:predicted Zn-dependent peptidase
MNEMGLRGLENGLQRKTIYDGIHLNRIRDCRFKTGRLSAVMLLPLNADTACAYGILPFLMRRSCRQYPDFTTLQKKLSELYGASLSADVRKLGEVQALTLTAVGLDDRYALQGEAISAELFSLLCQSIFDPVVAGDAFEKDAVEQEKRQLLELIDSEYNDKRAYAKLRCEQLMCADEAFGTGRFGSREDVAALTPQRLYQAWGKMLREARFEFYLLGGSEFSGAEETIRASFGGVSRGETVQCKTEVVRKPGSVREFTDPMEVAQAKLVMGFRTGVAVPDEDVMAMRLMSALYGGTPNSKLFLNVREKLSLCYYCSSQYDRNKGIMLVQSGVEQKNLEKAQEEILNQLRAVQEGDFTEEDLHAAKMSVSNSFLSSADYLSGLENWYVSSLFDQAVLTPQEAARSIESVTKQQVVQAAKRVALDTVYRLTAEEGKR